MRKVTEWLDKNLPTIWGYLIFVIITVALVGLLLLTTNWAINVGGKLL